MPKPPYLIGITGGIGAGKSLVSNLLRRLNYDVYNSDKASKQLVNSNGIIKQKVSKAFGKEAYLDNLYNTKYIAQIVFKDRRKIEQLNKIIHPEVAKHFKSWVSKRKNHTFLFKEAAILIESNSYKSLDSTLLITAPKDERINRVIKRDAISKEQIVKRINQQLTDEQKKPYADFFINNTSKELLLPKVISYLSSLKVSFKSHSANNINS